MSRCDPFIAGRGAEHQSPDCEGDGFAPFVSELAFSVGDAGEGPGPEFQPLYRTVIKDTGKCLCGRLPVNHEIPSSHPPHPLPLRPAPKSLCSACRQNCGSGRRRPPGERVLTEIVLLIIVYT